MLVLLEGKGTCLMFVTECIMCMGFLCFLLKSLLYSSCTVHSVLIWTLSVFKIPNVFQQICQACKQLWQKHICWPLFKKKTDFHMESVATFKAFASGSKCSSVLCTLHGLSRLACFQKWWRGSVPKSGMTKCVNAEASFPQVKICAFKNSS